MNASFTATWAVVVCCGSPAKLIQSPQGSNIMKQTGPRETRSQVAFVEFWGAKRHLDTSMRGEKALGYQPGWGWGTRHLSFSVEQEPGCGNGWGGWSVSEQGLQIEKVTGPQGKVTSLLHTSDPQMTRTQLTRRGGARGGTEKLALVLAEPLPAAGTCSPTGDLA